MGTNMFDQFKEKIHSVQQDLNAGLKSLSEKAKEVGRSKKLPGDFHVLDSKTADLSALKPECVDAGDEILNRFQQMWTQLHINIEFSAEKAVKSDKVILELVEKHEKQLQGWKQLQTRLKEVPVMVTQVQNLAGTLGKLEANFEEIESMLKSLEDTCEEEELLGNKKIQVAELVKYKELKSKERQQRKDRLMDEYNQKFRRVEDKEDAKKKERQKAFQDVFAADMAHYRTHGKMSAPVTQSSQDLENQLDDFELAIGRDDQQALDDFLGPDDFDDADDESSDDQSSARKKHAPSKKERVVNNESDEDDDDQDKDVVNDQDNDDEEGNESRDNTREDAASADKMERTEDGPSGEEEKQKEETRGSDSLHTEIAEAKDELDSNQDQTVNQDHIEQSGKDSLETPSDTHQIQDNQATKDGESIQEEEEEDDDDDDDDDFGTPDEDGD